MKIVETQCEGIEGEINDETGFHKLQGPAGAHKGPCPEQNTTFIVAASTTTTRSGLASCNYQRLVL